MEATKEMTWAGYQYAQSQGWTWLNEASVKEILAAALAASPETAKALDAETLRPLHEAVNTRCHVKVTPSQAIRILSALETQE